ncbi:LysR substrate-binding domain-containing protein [Actinoallomurus sp. NPDC050550]|uniref:LysR substrate-binding domain-containing protein n=1 Tax=Actinoallomurus sp. NPDC050550 TaxID=3154937 RepID=UPI0033F869CB
MVCGTRAGPVRAAANDRTSTVRVGQFGGAAELTEPILEADTARYPSVRLTLVDLPPHKAETALREAVVDVALLRPPIDTDFLIATTLFQEPFLNTEHEWIPRSGTPRTVLNALVPHVHPRVGDARPACGPLPGGGFPRDLVAPVRPTAHGEAPDHLSGGTGAPHAGTRPGIPDRSRSVHIR